MVDEACRQEGSPVSVDAHDLPVECPASLLEEICEAALAESVRQPHVAVEFNGELFGKNLDINYLVPFRHRRAEVCGVLFGSREETRVQLRDFRRLVMQGDGNLVEYQGSKALWASNTAGDNGATVTMQGDGNLVIYLNGTPKWASNTAGHAGAYLPNGTLKYSSTSSMSRGRSP